ncbi:hypothetical protein K449DRAFT_13762 [Hypoxylon sp. EC38]|nr:hypothetical protein K449DRAFT_13762 [Hypoxylon sp. EC38]
MRSSTAKRAIRALKRALTRTAHTIQTQSRFPHPSPQHVSARNTPSPVTSAVQKGVQDISSLLLNLLEKFLELNQYIAPVIVFDLRDNCPSSSGGHRGLTSSYVIISSTASLLALSRSAPNASRASACECDGDIPLVPLAAALRRVPSISSRLSDPFRDPSIDDPRSSISAWASVRDAQSPSSSAAADPSFASKALIASRMATATVRSRPEEPVAV